MKRNYDARAFLGLLLIVLGVTAWILALVYNQDLGLVLGIALAGTGMAIQIRRVTRTT
jgi:hypothetical protein